MEKVIYLELHDEDDFNPLIDLLRADVLTTLYRLNVGLSILLAPVLQVIERFGERGSSLLWNVEGD